MKTWTQFRDLPGIMQFGAWLVLMILTMLALPKADAQEQEQEVVQVQARVLCRGEEIAAIQMKVPRAGVITVEIPPGICRNTKSV